MEPGEMEEIELQINPAGTGDQLATLIEEAAVLYGLQIRIKSTLRTYPGSQHWHMCKPGERGTLEVTLWPAGKRVWFSVHSNRRAEWITEVLPRIIAWIEEQLPPAS
jgi:hypothetical protein